MPEPGTPLTRLVLFTVCLSIAGAFVAGAHYYAIDLPQQNALEGPPYNSNTNSLGNKCPTCLASCTYLPENEKYECLGRCDLVC